jgi:hypothetical protein
MQTSSAVRIRSSGNLGPLHEQKIIPAFAKGAVNLVVPPACVSEFDDVASRGIELTDNVIEARRKQWPNRYCGHDASLMDGGEHVELRSLHFCRTGTRGSIRSPLNRARLAHRG